MHNPYQLKNTGHHRYTGVQLALQTSLLQLLATHSLASLTVRQLCQQAAVARSSFYAYYENISDLLTEIEDDFVTRLADLDQKIMDPQRQTVDDFKYLSALIDFASQEQNLIQALLIKNYDYQLVNKWKEAIKHHLWERITPLQDTIQTRLVFEMFASGVISAFIFSIQHQDQLTKNDVYEIAAKALKMLA